jgi:hypothetical protein
MLKKGAMAEAGCQLNVEAIRKARTAYFFSERTLNLWVKVRAHFIREAGLANAVALLR